MRSHIGLAMFAVIAGAASPGLSQAPQQSAPPKPPTSQPAIAEQRKSSFTTAGATRNPFWPVGWMPGDGKKVEEVPTITASLFNVSAILLGPPNLAVINGKDYAEGDTLSIAVGGKEERVRIDAIRDGFLLLNHRGRPITVALNRGNEPKTK